MKNKFILILLPILIVVVVLIIPSSEQKTSVTPSKVNAPQEIIDENLANIYKDYSPTTLKEAQEKGDTLLFFHAVWCLTCKSAEKDIARNFELLPENLTILKTDYDTELALRKKYNLVRQHAYVQVDKEGNEITMWYGGGVRTILDNLE